MCTISTVVHRFLITHPHIVLKQAVYMLHTGRHEAMHPCKATLSHIVHSTAPQQHSMGVTCPGAAGCQHNLALIKPSRQVATVQ